MARDKDDLWRNFPKTAIEFDRRFATEEACRTYWIEARWGGEPACARCGSKRVWAERGGFLFECGDCDHQTSLTSGTLLEKTRKPFKVWFRAVFEISSRRNGISAKELQRILGFGSYKTAWSWLHKLRAALVRPDREPLGFRADRRDPRRGKGLTPQGAGSGGRRSRRQGASRPRRQQR